MPRGRRERGTCQESRLEGRDWEVLQGKLVPGWEERAREHGAFRRRRAVGSAGDLLRLVLGAAVLGWGRPLVAAWAAVIALGGLSAEAVGKRVRRSRAWLGVEVGLLLQVRRERWAGRAGRTVRVRLVDATTISEPGSHGTDWRAHAVLDLETGALSALELTDQHGAEGLARHPYEPGAIAVADRVHARRTDFGVLLARGTDLVVRMGWQNLPLECPDGGRLDLIGWLTSPVLVPSERPVVVQTPTGRYPLRLIAAPLPPEQAEQARRRCRQNAAKKGRTVDDRTLIAAGFVLLVTTLDDTTWPLDDILCLYRYRWQIELCFKRLKSIWHLDQLRARDDDAIQAHLLAVILAALLAGDVARDAPIPLDHWLDDRDHPLSRWRWAALWHAAALDAIRGPVSLLSIQRCLADLRPLLTLSPRRRRLHATDARLLLRSHAPLQEAHCA